jgi:hypothetical protein
MADVDGARRVQHGLVCCSQAICGLPLWAMVEPGPGVRMQRGRSASGCGDGLYMVIENDKSGLQGFGPREQWPDRLLD